MQRSRVQLGLSRYNCIFSAAMLEAQHLSIERCGNSVRYLRLFTCRARHVEALGNLKPQVGARGSSPARACFACIY
jgi:hypothetical protein